MFTTSEATTRRFRTFHVVKKNNGEDVEIGRVVAVTLPVDDEKSTFKTQFSFWSPKDPFSRAVGKFVAEKRLEGRTSITFTKGSDTITQTLKGLIANEAVRKRISWWLNPTPEDLV